MATRPTPTQPLGDWITAYQKAHPYSPQAYTQLITDANAAGYNVAQATHANNTLASQDAIVDPTGNAYDLVYNSDGPDAHWQNNPAGTYDPSRSVVSNGKFIPYSDWAKQYQSASGSSTTGTTQTGTGGTQTGTSTYPQTQGSPYVIGQNGFGGRMAYVTKPKPATDRNLASYTSTVIASADRANAASAASMRARAMALRGGRRSTILGGFGAGTPSTAPATVLGY